MGTRGLQNTGYFNRPGVKRQSQRMRTELVPPLGLCYNGRDGGRGVRQHPGLVARQPQHGKCDLMMNDQTNEYTEWDHEAGKRIACAVMSYQAGVTYESLWAQYADQEGKPGTFWL